MNTLEWIQLLFGCKWTALIKSARQEFFSHTCIHGSNHDIITDIGIRRKPSWVGKVSSGLEDRTAKQHEVD